tara:strand:- start:481 stop:702 length:222 start_codon:yes stop_codon:yes gene_type:complete
MIFLADVAFSIELLALAAGVALFVWSLRNKGAGQFFAKFFGMVVIISAILGIICTSYYSFSYWVQGSFSALSS